MVDPTPADQERAAVVIEAVACAHTLGPRRVLLNACTRCLRKQIATALAEQRKPLRVYLDEAIRNWRVIRDTEGHEHAAIAPCYIDAFQSVRVSMLGEVLPVTTKEG